jgi:hypothetical protein
MVRPPDTRGNEVTTFSNYSQQLFAVVGAFAITVLLFANSLSVHAADVQAAAGIIA